MYIHFHKNVIQILLKKRKRHLKNIPLHVGTCGLHNKIQQVVRLLHREAEEKDEASKIEGDI